MSTMTTAARRAETAADIAASLRQVADLLDRNGSLQVGSAYASLSIQPGGGEQAAIAAIDGIGQLLTGTPGELEPMSGGTFHYGAKAHIGAVPVHAFTGATSPAEKQLRAEIEHLRAQLAAAPAAVS